MAQWLRILVVLPEDPGQIPSTHVVAYSLSVTPVLGDLNPHFASMGANCAHGPQTYIQAKHHIHKIKTKKKRIGLLAMHG